MATILTALNDGELSSKELWQVAQEFGAEIAEHQGRNILERMPMGRGADIVAMYHQLVELALLGDIREGLKEVVQTNQQTVTLLNMIAEKIGVGPEDEEETDEEDV